MKASSSPKYGFDLVQITIPVTGHSFGQCSSYQLLRTVKLRNSIRSVGHWCCHWCYRATLSGSAGSLATFGSQLVMLQFARRHASGNCLYSIAHWKRSRQTPAWQCFGSELYSDLSVRDCRSLLDGVHLVTLPCLLFLQWLLDQDSCSLATLISSRSSPFNCGTMS